VKRKSLSVRLSVRRLLIMGTCIAALGQSAASASAASWPQLGFSSAHTGFNPLETTLTPANVSSLQQSCVTDPSSISGPAVAGGRAYVVGWTGVYSFDARTCAPIWSADLGSYIQARSVAIAGGMVYVGTYETSTLYALDAATGSIRWTKRLGGPVLSSPVVAQGRVLVGANNGALYALDAASGRMLWKAWEPGAQSAGAPHPSVANGVVYVSGGASINAYRATTGKLLWTVPLRGGEAPPAVGDGRVYVQSFLTGLYALDAATGAQLWSNSLPESITSAPTLAYGRLYVRSIDHELYALDGQSGATVWKTTIGDLSEPPLSNWREAPPTVANGVAYLVEDENSVVGADAATGTILWRSPARNSLWAPVVVVNGRVYVSARSASAGLLIFSLPRS
jgi:eukaryotic-like serine/threonine-protein kinase